MTPEEDHQEAEAQQEHGQDMDGPGVVHGVENGAGGVVQAVGVDGHDGAQALGNAVVDGREERHCHQHGDDQEDDQQPDVAVGFHGVCTVLSLKKIR